MHIMPGDEWLQAMGAHTHKLKYKMRWRDDAVDNTKSLVIPLAWAQ